MLVLSADIINGFTYFSVKENKSNKKVVTVPIEDKILLPPRYHIFIIKKFLVT